MSDPLPHTHTHTDYRGWVCHIHFHYISQQALTPVYSFRSQYARVQLCEVYG